MDTRRWPLSIAATRRLLDLRADPAPRTPDGTLVALTFKELIVLGTLRLDAITQQRRRRLVHVRPVPPSTTLPPATQLLADRIAARPEGELEALVQGTLRSNPGLGAALRAAAEQELRDLRLAEPRERRLLRVLPRRFEALTPTGQPWQHAAREAVGRGGTLVQHARASSTIDPDAVEELGRILILVPGGLEVAARVSAEAWLAARVTPRRDDGTGGDAAPGAAVGPAPADASATADSADPIAAADDPSLVDRFGESLESLLGALEEAVGGVEGAIEGAVQSIESAVTSAIDSGVSGADGGDGGGGD